MLSQIRELEGKEALCDFPDQAPLLYGYGAMLKWEPVAHYLSSLLEAERLVLY